MSANPPLAGAPTSCDISALPTVDTWPLLPDHAEHISRLEQFGVIELDEIGEAMRHCPRGAHALPFPLADEVPNLEASSLRLPWIADLDAPNALLPGLFETSQVLQLLQPNPRDVVLLIGPRGNWWTEILMRAGCAEVVVVEPDADRLAELRRRWTDLRLEVAAQAFDCAVVFTDVAGIDRYRPDRGYDRILSTCTLPEIPIGLLSRMQPEGIAVLPIETEDDRPMLQFIQHHGESELLSQWITHWNAPSWDVDVVAALARPELAERCVGSILEPERAAIEAAWQQANLHPIRDRFGPEEVLDMVEEIWAALDPVHRELEGGVLAPGLREVMADDLFRMGHVLQQMAIHDLAAEHHGEAFRLAPTAESATFLAWGLSESDDVWGALGWCRKAIECDARLGNPWNDVGAILLAMGQPAAAIPWLATATKSQRYDAPGHPWSNLARAHEMMGHRMAAFEAARTALEHTPEDEVCLRIIRDLDMLL